MGLSHYVGELMLVSFIQPVPRDWLVCDGALLPIALYQKLYSLLGTTFGGNGTTTFGLPDLRGRVPMSSGQGPGLANYPLGQLDGSEAVTLMANQMPAHSHNVVCDMQAAAATMTVNPSNTFPSTPAAALYSSKLGDVPFAPTLSSFGAANPLPHENRQPYLAMQWLIATNGESPAMKS